MSKGRTKATPFKVATLVKNCPNASFRVSVELTPVQMQSLGIETVNMSRPTVVKTMAINSASAMADEAMV